MDKRNIEDVLALTPMQEGMLFHYLKDPTSDYYFEQLSLEISGEIDTGIFQEAWDFVIETNEMLRTVFQWEKVEKPIQVILKKHKLQPGYYDFPGETDNRKKSKLEEIKIADRQAKFDLRKVPFRVTLCRLKRTKHVMIISNHHILYDGWSNGIILREFFKAYDDLSNGKKLIKPIKTKFKEFVKRIQDQDKEKQEKFWQKYLRGFDTQTEFSVKKRKGKEISGTVADSFKISFSRELKNKIEDFVKSHRITWAVLFYSAWGILLQRYNNSEDAIFGTTVSGRNPKLHGIEEIAGLFINTLPLLIRTDANEKTGDFLSRLDKELQKRETFETTNLVEIKGYSEIDYREELFDTLVIIENYPLDSRLRLENFNLSLDSYSIFERTHYDLTVGIMLFDEIEIKFSYQRGFYDIEAIENLARHFKEIIQNIIAAPETMVSQLEIISVEEKNRVLNEFNNTAAEYPEDKNIHELFEEQAERTPDHIAVFGQRQTQPNADNSPLIAITYRKLDEQSDWLAHLLIEKGVLTDNIVGIMANPSIDILIGIFGILKSAGAYLPIDPNYPMERIDYMLEDSGAKLMVTIGNLVKEGGKLRRWEGELILLEEIPKSPKPHTGIFLPPTGNRKPAAQTRQRATSLIYIIYTSGTTGKPKGVMVEHQEVVNYIWWAKKKYIKGERINLPLYTSITFDMTVTSIFTPLITGNAIVVYNEKEIKQALIEKIIDDNRVEVVKVTPSHLKLLEDKKIYYSCPSIERFIVGGEELKTPLAKKIFENFGNSIEIYNEYGPTEAAVGCMIYKYDYKKDTRESVPIGHPIANAQIYILDRNMIPIPPGVIGEIYISGDGIARGYLNQPELTGERFIYLNLKGNQGNNGKGLGKYRLKLYRTGDLAWWHTGGDIAFWGRIDHQVKIRGFRIELREIEKHLLNHPGIREAVVTVKKDRDNENYLCSWVVIGKDRPAPELSDLKTYLAQKLPHYMVPTYIIPLERLPLTRTGKVDRKALSEWEINRSQIKQTYAAPQTDVEKIIAGAWKEVLKSDEVGVEDNFFDLGGNSLSIIRLNTKLKEIFKKDIPLVTLFNYPTVGTQSKYFGGEAAVQPMVTTKQAAGKDIAVIGMAGRFPGAGNIDEFWDNLKNGKESITFFTDEELDALGVDPEIYHHPHYVKAKGVLENMEYFDAQFFDYSAREARLMDPQLRLLHECVWEALENAGYVPGSFTGSIGLYVGALSNAWWMQHLNHEITTHADLLAVGSLNDRDYLATRISYKLELKGPAVTVQTACSTSLTAIDTACQALMAARCGIALAGGVALTFQDRGGYLLEEGMVRSPDGHCRPFDARAKGTVGGNGVGIVVLKPLKEAVADNDNIRALIKGSATNNDGSRKVGYTAPSVQGQVEVIQCALNAAAIDPGTVTYLETHGTGTPLGDPVEIEALTQAFNTGKKEFCALGAVKANIGHLDTAAGVAGFIKTVLALEHHMIPPLINFFTPNPQIDFENSPFYVNTQLKEWKHETSPLRAGVSSFGIGGTNAHVILEEAPTETRDKEGTRGLAPLLNAETSKKYHLILLSAQTQSALEKMSQKLSRHFQKKSHINLSDAAYTLLVGRKTFKHRAMLVCSTVKEAMERLSTQEFPKLRFYQLPKDGYLPLVFMFPGQGSQYVNMGLELYRKEKVFCQEMERCFEILAPLVDCDLKEILYPGERKANKRCAPCTVRNAIDQTEIAQPLLFAFEYALSKLLITWGIKPYAMIGHSIGEYVAACLAGVFTLDDALRLVAARGQLMQQSPVGAMLGIPLPVEELIPLLSNELSMAAVNSPSDCVVSGPLQAIEAFEKQMGEKGIKTSRIHTSHAFHSTMMEPILKEFTGRVKQIRLNKPQIPYISNLSGNWIRDEEAMDPWYWARHIRETVQFAGGLKKLFEKDKAIFVEVGPGRVLNSFVGKSITPGSHQVTVNLISHPREAAADYKYLIEKIGYLWLYGAAIHWPGFYRGCKRQRIALPTYPFEGQRYWLEDEHPGYKTKTPPPNSLPKGKKNVKDWFYIPSWRHSILPPADQQDPSETFTWLAFVNECRLCDLVVHELVNQGHNVKTIRIGPTYHKENDSAYIINPKVQEEYDILFRDILTSGKIPGKIIHMWNITGSRWGQRSLPGQEGSVSPGGEGSIEAAAEAQHLGFYSLVYLAAAICRQDFKGKCQVSVITDNMQNVAGEEWLCPEKATVLGPVQVIPQEYSNINCRSIDLVLPGLGRLQEKNLLNMLLRELRTKITVPIIAYRGNHRLVQAFSPLRLGKPEKNPIRLQQGGVYLVTGGFGGMGLTMAQYLVKKVKAKIILVGRTALPPRNEWEKCLMHHNLDEGVSRRIREILGLEKLGGEVFPAIADVADFEQMQQVISDALVRFGAIHGVIHAAGLPGDGVIQRKTPELMEPVLNPKLKGTLILDRLLRNEQLDFFVLCSSINSIIGTFGQVDYTAANRFLDAFAYDKVARDGTFCVSINWGGWAEVGMAHRFAMKVSEGKNIPADGEGILPQEGIEAFTRILENNLVQVVVSPRDFIESIEKNKSSTVIERVKSLHNVQIPQITHLRSRLSNTYVDPSTRTEQLLTDMWCAFFGTDRIGINDNFFELGATSLDLVQLNSRLKAKFNQEIPIEKMFTYPTISTLARYLEREQSGSNTINECKEAGKTKRAAAGERGQELLRRRRVSVNERQNG